MALSCSPAGATPEPRRAVLVGLCGAGAAVAGLAAGLAVFLWVLYLKR